jgi:carbamoyl-phosphate synthase large subunit
MKSVGEVMSIGRNFEEALQKALRMTGIGAPGLAGDDSLCGQGLSNIKEALQKPTDRRIFIIYRALMEGWTVDKIHRLTKIDKWFLYKIANALTCEQEIRGIVSREQLVVSSGREREVSGGKLAETSGKKKKPANTKTTPYSLLTTNYLLPSPLLSRAKQLGFSDARIGEFVGMSEEEVRALRET